MDDIGIVLDEEIVEQQQQNLDHYHDIHHHHIHKRHTTTTNIKRRKLKFCKLDMFFECFNEPIAYFTSQPNGTGFARTEEEYEQFCL